MQDCVYDELLTKINPLHQPVRKIATVENKDGVTFHFSRGPVALHMKDFFTPLKIIHNGPATIVFWNDKTKTIVKLSEKDKDNIYNAFCAALAKKIFGSNSKVNAIVSGCKEE